MKGGDREHMAVSDQQPPNSQSTSQRRVGVKLPRVSGARVLWALVLMFVSMPFLEQFEFGQFAESVLLSIVLCTAVVAVGSDRRNLMWAIVLMTPAVVGKWVFTLHPRLMPPEVFLLSALLCVGHVALCFLRFIVKARRVDANVLCSGVAAFLLLALLWGLAYSLLDRLAPGSFVATAGPESSHKMVGFTALYFSLVTLCTVGFGDIVPVTGPARMLAMMEGMTGVFFVAVMVSRLVSMYAVEKPDDHG